jgi:hypothetical protein
MTKRELMQACGLTKHQAVSDLRLLVNDGKAERRWNTALGCSQWRAVW